MFPTQRKQADTTALEAPLRGKLLVKSKLEMTALHTL